MLPYSVRVGCLTSFVNAVLDADAGSPQHYSVLAVDEPAHSSGGKQQIPAIEHGLRPL